VSGFIVLDPRIESEDLFKEVERQVLLRKYKRSEYFDYIQELTRSCLHSAQLQNFKECRDRVLKYLVEIDPIDPDSFITNKSSTMVKEIFDNSIYSQHRHGTDPRKSFLIFNNMHIKGEVSPQYALTLVCSGLSPFPQSCSEDSIAAIAASLDTTYFHDQIYDYMGYSVFMTLSVTLLFSFYIVTRP